MKSSKANTTQDAYLHIPKSLFHSNDLSLTDIIVFCLLNQFVVNGENPSQKELSESLEITDRTVRTSLQHLQSKGFLKIHSNGRHNNYEILR